MQKTLQIWRNKKFVDERETCSPISLWYNDDDVTGVRLKELYITEKAKFLTDRNIQFDINNLRNAIMECKLKNPYSTLILGDNELLKSYKTRCLESNDILYMHVLCELDTLVYMLNLE